MLAIEKYQIEKNFIPGLPQEPFRKGVGQYEGVCLHATAVYNDTPEGERSYESRHFEDAFVHSFNDENKILQVADWDYISYGCNHSGNQFLLNFELCQDHDHNLFLQGYDRWVWQAAYALFVKGLPVINHVTLWSHKLVTDTFHEGDHQDPIAYLAEHGYTWDMVVRDVTNYHNQFKEEQAMLEQLQEQVARLQQEVTELKAHNSMAQIPVWASEAVQSAVNGKLMDSPEGRSYDLYSILTILHRKGLI